MRLYCIDLLAGLAIALGSFITGGAVITAVNDDGVDQQEINLINQGYTKTNYTYNQLRYSSYEECVEYKNKFYCY